jgi:hypothetical protein
MFPKIDSHSNIPANFQNLQNFIKFQTEKKISKIKVKYSQNISKISKNFKNFQRIKNFKKLTISKF